MGITKAAGKDEIVDAFNFDGGYIFNGNSKKEGIFNNTYTLSKLQYEAKLGNCTDSIETKGNFIDGSLSSNQTYTVYGQPNKFIYDYSQQWNNCGVDSSLNILSVAGKKNISQLTIEEEKHNRAVAAAMREAEANNEFY